MSSLILCSYVKLHSVKIGRIEKLNILYFYNFDVDYPVHNNYLFLHTLKTRVILMEGGGGGFI